MNLEELTKFCDPDHKELCKPWTHGEFSFASNGHIAVRVPIIKGISVGIPFKTATEIPWIPTECGEWIYVPDYMLPEKIKCRTCWASGSVDNCPECEGESVLTFSNSFHSYEVECDTCHGEGCRPGASKKCTLCSGKGFTYKEKCVLAEDVGNDEHGVNCFLLEKIKHLPSIKLFSEIKNNVFRFKFDGGVGVIAGMIR